MVTNRPGTRPTHPAHPVRPTDAAEPKKDRDEIAEPEESVGSRLIVGRDIQVKGEIVSCDTLVVEGRVEASMDSRVIRIAESGVFIGEAGVDTAEIIGRFEGKLTTRKRLVIRPTGRVSGTIRYGAIQIEEGGQIMGDVQVISKGGAQEEKRPPEQREASRGNGPDAEQQARSAPR